jgi:hypothetical protein
MRKTSPALFLREKPFVDRELDREREEIYSLYLFLPF